MDSKASQAARQANIRFGGDAGLDLSLLAGPVTFHILQTVQHQSHAALRVTIFPLQEIKNALLLDGFLLLRKPSVGGASLDVQ